MNTLTMQTLDLQLCLQCLREKVCVICTTDIGRSDAFVEPMSWHDRLLSPLPQRLRGLSWGDTAPTKP